MTVADLHAAEFVVLERLLAHLQFSDGEIDDRVLALPTLASMRAAQYLWALGWLSTDVRAALARPAV
jgi:hypothetical protein